MLMAFSNINQLVGKNTIDFKWVSRYVLLRKQIYCIHFWYLITVLGTEWWKFKQQISPKTTLTGDSVKGEKSKGPFARINREPIFEVTSMRPQI